VRIYLSHAPLCNFHRHDAHATADDGPGMACARPRDGRDGRDGCLRMADRVNTGLPCKVRCRVQGRDALHLDIYIVKVEMLHPQEPPRVTFVCNRRQYVGYEELSHATFLLSDPARVGLFYETANGWRSLSVLVRMPSSDIDTGACPIARRVSDTSHVHAHAVNAPGRALAADTRAGSACAELETLTRILGLGVAMLTTSHQEGGQVPLHDHSRIVIHAQRTPLFSDLPTSGTIVVAPRTVRGSEEACPLLVEPFDAYLLRSSSHGVGNVSIGVKRKLRTRWLASVWEAPSTRVGDR
tara:strand:- start:3622 stop:4512 length:891 start_codon:yes stop_codon:yes gene_type:complete